jgi:uncharacterized protein YcaQ
MSHRTTLTISPEVQRRFVLGRQGLWPARRWRGVEGAVAALRECEAVQIDPLCVTARNHDLTLYSRVAEYRPEHLEEICWTRREAFDYGGCVFIYPMDELPHWRHAMRRHCLDGRWHEWSALHPDAIDRVRREITARGPLGNRDFDGTRRVNSYRGSKDTGVALYYLWICGELMTHHRVNFQRKFDLSERVAPARLLHTSNPAEAESHFARKGLAWPGIAALRHWKSWYGAFLRPEADESVVRERIGGMLDEGVICPVMVQGDREPKAVLAEDLPLLQAIAAGAVPDAWRPLSPEAPPEVNILAPLDIVSARGRARPLFSFEYVWEVYKPERDRRWGYYTQPILYGDRLVGRLDPRLDRRTRTLSVNGFWLEEHADPRDTTFGEALGLGLARFARFCGADQVDPAAILPARLRRRAGSALRRSGLKVVAG